MRITISGTRTDAKDFVAHLCQKILRVNGFICTPVDEDRHPVIGPTSTSFDVKAPGSTPS